MNGLPPTQVTFAPELPCMIYGFRCQNTLTSQFLYRHSMSLHVCIQPPQVPSQIAGHGGAAYALARQPEGTSAGSRLGGGVLSIQAMTAPCR